MKLIYKINWLNIFSAQTGFLISLLLFLSRYSRVTLNTTVNVHIFHMNLSRTLYYHVNYIKETFRILFCKKTFLGVCYVIKCNKYIPNRHDVSKFLQKTVLYSLRMSSLENSLIFRLAGTEK